MFRTSGARSEGQARSRRSHKWSNSLLHYSSSRMMKSLEVERVRSRAAGDRDSDTIIDLRTALEIGREIRNGLSGKIAFYYHLQHYLLIALF